MMTAQTILMIDLAQLLILVGLVGYILARRR